MIEIQGPCGAVVKAKVQVVASRIVTLAVVCPTDEIAAKLNVSFLRGLRRRRVRPAAALTPADPFVPGQPVRVSTYAWDEGEMAIAATVVRRLGPQQLLVRTRMGREIAVDQRDVERGGRAL